MIQNQSKKAILSTGSFLLLFLLFTLLVTTVDVQPIGPQQSAVGLAGLNQAAFQLFGVNPLWTDITDALGAVAIITALGFAVAGLMQLIRRKSLFKLDFHLLSLGVFYGVLLAVYAFFELAVINYRPILLGEDLEASYPSSHVMLVVCILATAMLQFHHYFRGKALLWLMDSLSVLMIAVTVVGRLLSGVHWFTDIVAGALLSAALISLYCLTLQFAAKGKHGKNPHKH